MSPYFKQLLIVKICKVLSLKFLQNLKSHPLYVRKYDRMLTSKPLMAMFIYFHPNEIVTAAIILFCQPQKFISDS